MNTSLAPSRYPFDIVRWQLWDGTLDPERSSRLQPMQPVIEDLRRPEDRVLMTWHEHTQWRWKQWEYASVLGALDLEHAARYRVLDAGCGYTPLIRYLGSLGMEAYGFDWDVDADQSQIGRSARLLHGDRVQYHHQDLRALKWPSDFFDYTVSVSVLEHLFLSPHLFGKLVDRLLPPPRKIFHLRNIESAISELVRVTKPGGTLALTLDCGGAGGLRTAVIERLFGVAIPDFPSLDVIHTYWANDPYYIQKNRYIPSTVRDYTAFFVVLRKRAS